MTSPRSSPRIETLGESRRSSPIAAHYSTAVCRPTQRALPAVDDTTASLTARATEFVTEQFRWTVTDAMQTDFAASFATEWTKLIQTLRAPEMRNETTTPGTDDDRTYNVLAIGIWSATVETGDYLDVVLGTGKRAVAGTLPPHSKSPTTTQSRERELVGVGGPTGNGTPRG